MKALRSASRRSVYQPQEPELKGESTMIDTSSYLATLRRIPDDVILSMATRPIDLPHYNSCVCAWAARETYARKHNADAGDDLLQHTGLRLLEAQYGGDAETEWQRVNQAFRSDAESALLEEAFVDRVLECVA
jgi:hypothetical protein